MVLLISSLFEIIKLNINKEPALEFGYWPTFNRIFRERLYGILAVALVPVSHPTETSRCTWTAPIKVKHTMTRMIVLALQLPANFKYFFPTSFFFTQRCFIHRAQSPHFFVSFCCLISNFLLFIIYFSFPCAPGPLVWMVSFVPVLMVACIKRLTYLYPLVPFIIPLLIMHIFCSLDFRFYTESFSPF